MKAKIRENNLKVRVGTRSAFENRPLPQEKYKQRQRSQESRGSRNFPAQIASGFFLYNLQINNYDYVVMIYFQHTCSLAMSSKAKGGIFLFFVLSCQAIRQTEITGLFFWMQNHLLLVSINNNNSKQKKPVSRFYQVFCLS